MGKPMNQVQTLVDNNMNPFLKKRKNNTVKSKKEKKIFESHKKKKNGVDSIMILQILGVQK